MDIAKERLNFTTILGIRFFDGSVDDLLTLTRRGGLFVVPSGPGLAELDFAPTYRDALEQSDVAVTDSGAMALIWRIRAGYRINRISGLKYIRALLTLPEFRDPGRVFWVMPSGRESAANLTWLNEHGYPTTNEDTYIAPHYPAGRISDPALLAVLERRQPQFVVLCIGGGVQERLGHSLRDSLHYRPAIICTGAAIAFITGQQAAIPVWVDRMMLGWLLRCLWAPRRFVPRYFKSLRLIPLLWRFGASPVRP
ncbi:MAG TPA: WecB/TagA/CpsF family glycosyltransferase [Gemmatimonadaceae bacterium]|nr:WecB/TagA/CpsF family glycosyltransferase [Gemmatimonadaceae bacterium]